MGRDLKRDKGGIKDEILSTLDNFEIAERTKKYIDINKLKILINRYLNSFLYDIKKEKIEHIFTTKYKKILQAPSGLTMITLKKLIIATLAVKAGVGKYYLKDK